MHYKKTLKTRRVVQAAVFLLFLYIIWSTKYPLKGFFNPIIFFQLDPLVMLVTALAQRLLFTGLILTAVTLIITFVFGRVFCGWFCPMGTLIDGISYIKEKLFKRKYRENEPGIAKNIKYVILAGIVICAFFGIQAAWFFDPITIFMRTFSFNIFPFINNSIDKLFGALLRATDFPAFLESIYNILREHVLSANNPVFPLMYPVMVFFLVILAAVLIKRRFWCRYICPLGALLAVVARFSPFVRKVQSCRGNCSTCRNLCRMNAIRALRADNTYRKEECILCLDCIVTCPGQSTFDFKKNRNVVTPVKNGITRSQFLLYLAGGMSLLSGFRFRHRHGQGKQPSVIRPPGALPEDEFIQRCIRCGNCMKVCPTNVLQPALLESGLQGIWTPRFHMGIGYCEYNCNLCGQVCPTGAIPKLSVAEKTSKAMGFAAVIRNRCLVWEYGKECLVCEEHCPVPGKAIRTRSIINKDGKRLQAPIVDPSLCIGCGICENKCPVRPFRAIKVKPT